MWITLIIFLVLLFAFLIGFELKKQSQYNRFQKHVLIAIKQNLNDFCNEDSNRKLTDVVFNPYVIGVNMATVTQIYHDFYFKDAHNINKLYGDIMSKFMNDKTYVILPEAFINALIENIENTKFVSGYNRMCSYLQRLKLGGDITETDKCRKQVFDLNI